jgi:hypothetical protein
MTMTRKYQRTTFQMFALMVSLFWLLSPWWVVWCRGNETMPEAPQPSSSVPQQYVAIDQGRLTVDLRDADVSEVLAQIGRQAGISRVLGLNVTTRVSGEFAGVPLEQGLRRLLQRAGLSHAIVYTPAPTGGVSIAEVRVFGATSPEAPPPLRDSSRDRDEQRNVAEDRGADGASEVSAELSSVGQSEVEVVTQHIHALLPWVGEHRSEALISGASADIKSDGEESADEMSSPETGALTPCSAGSLMHSAQESLSTGILRCGR